MRRLDDPAIELLLVAGVVFASLWLGLLIGRVTAQADALKQVERAVEMAEQAHEIARDALDAQAALTARLEALEEARR